MTKASKGNAKHISHISEESLTTTTLHHCHGDKIHKYNVRWRTKIFAQTIESCFDRYIDTFLRGTEMWFRFRVCVGVHVCGEQECKEKKEERAKLDRNRKIEQRSRKE